jgi:Tfp pilus assembly protein PilO
MPKSSGDGQATALAVEHRSDRARQIAPVLLVVLAVLNALFFLLALRPAETRASQEQERLRKVQDDLKERRARVGRLRAIDSSLGEANREQTAFFQQKFLPRGTGYSTILEAIDKLGATNHVKRAGAAYTETDVPGHPELYQVEIQTAVEGEYANIIQFINQVERAPLFLLIDQVTAATGAAPTGPLALQQQNQARPVRLTLRLITYFRE